MNAVVNWISATGGARTSHGIPPYRLISMAGLVVFAVGLACVTLALAQPSLGIRFMRRASADSPPLVQSSTRLTDALRIRGAAGNSLQLRSDDMEREPDILFTSYTEFNRFLQRQDRLARILRSGEVSLLDSHQHVLTLHPHPHRRLDQLPFLFWYQLLTGTGCWMCGACILAFRRKDRAAWYMALSGFALMVCAAAAAVYSTRELALPGSTFRTLSAINHWGAMAACGAFIAVFWHYPKRLARIDLAPWLIGLYLLIAACDSLQILPLANYGIQLAVLAGGMGGGALALLQWRANRGDPVQQASLQWFLMSWCIGFGIYLAAVTIPALAGFDTGDLEGYAFGGGLLIALGLALGIARYRLFELGTWWFRAVLFLLGGASVILVDILLTRWLAFDGTEGAVVSLAVIGWAYFPLRQWLHGQIYTRMGRSRIGDLPTLLHAALGQQPDSIDRLLPDALQRLYDPLALKPLAKSPATVTVSDNGLALQVPGLDRLPGWEARWPDHGKRLFSAFDVRTMTAIHQVLGRIADYQQAERRGIEQERARLTQDLHDDIGARLLTLLHRHPGAVERDLRDVLERLRATVHGLGAQPLTLAQCLNEWQAEVVERCQAAGIKMVWNQPRKIPDHVPGATAQIDLARVLREAISNAFAHGQPTSLTITVKPSAKCLQVAVENDGVCTGKTLQPGLGLRNMRTRLARLGGTLDVRLNPPTARATWKVPLQTAANDRGRVQAPPIGG